MLEQKVELSADEKKLLKQIDLTKPLDPQRTKTMLDLLAENPHGLVVNMSGDSVAATTQGD